MYLSRKRKDRQIDAERNRNPINLIHSYLKEIESAIEILLKINTRLR